MLLYNFFDKLTRFLQDILGKLSSTITIHQQDVKPVDNELVDMQCADYILLMLGAPVLKIELDQSQVNHCICMAKELLNRSHRVTHSNYKMFLQELALAHAKIILGRIRSKYPNPAKGAINMDGDTLLSEGQAELFKLKVRLGLA